MAVEVHVGMFRQNRGTRIVPCTMRRPHIPHDLPTLSMRTGEEVENFNRLPKHFVSDKNQKKTCIYMPA